MRNDEPVGLGETLRQLAGRLRRVDLRIIDDVRVHWPEVVGPVLAEHCHPELVRDGALIVRVPSGAFAERINRDAASILAGFAFLGEAAPHTVRVRIAAPESNSGS